MKKTIPTIPKTEQAIIVIIDLPERNTWPFEERKKEFEKLVSSCGVEIAEDFTCKIKQITPKFFIGKGKIEEIAEDVMMFDADVVIFSEDLSPSQQKNLEEMLNCKTIDRTQLILDVFAQRARSNEGKVQVELAQLIYLLPRLSGKGIILSRIGGGLGTKGPGEQKLEIDRRRVRERIGKLKKILKDISDQRKTQRMQRDKISSTLIALVGYTNSGKSTLFNVLTESQVKVKDQFFSTLDPTIRKITLSNNRTALLSDTVGFLNELPHHLIESFKATLEEVINADILIHVLDISDNCIMQKKDAVIEILNELKTGNKPLFTVLNKSDKIDDSAEFGKIQKRLKACAVVSALKKRGLEEIRKSITEYIEKDMVELKLNIPHEKAHVIVFLRKMGVKFEEKYSEKGVYIKAKISSRECASIRKIMKN